MKRLLLITAALVVLTSSVHAGAYVNDEAAKGLINLMLYDKECKGTVKPFFLQAAKTFARENPERFSRLADVLAKSATITNGTELFCTGMEKFFSAYIER